jgi:Type VI secretion system effector, Hcp
MKSTHSWKWLVPRFISRHLRNSPAGKAATGRPCLTVERLEDRNLLSASTAATDIVVEPPPTGGDTQVLIGLLQGGLKVTQDEFQLLKVLGSASPTEGKPTMGDISVVKVVDKASVTLFQLSDTLVKVGADLIKGELTDKKLMAAEAKIEYLKIKLEDVIISSVDAQTQKTAMPIVDSLFADAGGLVQGLLGVEGAGTGTHKEMVDFVKLSADVLKIEGLAIKGELDFIKGGSPGLDLEDFQVKIDGVFQKANEAIMELGEPASSSLLPAVQDFENGIMNLLGSLSGGGNFDGGIVVPPTDDIIT